MVKSDLRDSVDYYAHHPKCTYCYHKATYTIRAGAIVLMRFCNIHFQQKMPAEVYKKMRDQEAKQLVNVTIKLSKGMIEQFRNQDINSDEADFIINKIYRELAHHHWYQLGGKDGR